MTGRFTVDDLARPLPLGRDARRIVSLAPSCTDCLLALGAADRLVGVDDHSEAAELRVARIGGFKDHDLARVVDLAPDLVVAASLHAVARAPALAARSIPVFVMHPRTVDGVVDGMARLASVIGIAREAAARVRACRERVAAVVRRTISARRRPLTYVELSPDGRTGGPQSFVDDLVAKAGGVNAGGVARVEWPVLRADEVARLDPDAIVVAAWPGSATPEGLAAREGWDRIAAVKAGRVWSLPASLVKRPGPGLIDGLERLSRLLSAE